MEEKNSNSMIFCGRTSDSNCHDTHETFPNDEFFNTHLKFDRFTDSITYRLSSPSPYSLLWINPSRPLRAQHPRSFVSRLGCHIITPIVQIRHCSLWTNYALVNSRSLEWPLTHIVLGLVVMVSFMFRRSFVESVSRRRILAMAFVDQFLSSEIWLYILRLCLLSRIRFVSSHYNATTKSYHTKHHHSRTYICLVQCDWDCILSLEISMTLIYPTQSPPEVG
ncbi:hypothetical protein C8Q75DRAFT_261238 [Abortiporus biennis]|nr:hypothetical protein C8Q75DRAFT_261238 [Abortiporus biennis]